MKSTVVAALVALLPVLSACGPRPTNPTVPVVECGSAALNLAAHSTCGAMDAQAVGEDGSHCFCLLGFSWDGAKCVSLGDCACQGNDCDKLAKTVEECQAQHATCAPTTYTCGSGTLHQKTHSVCGAMDAQAAADSSGGHCNCFLGFAWDGAQCVGLGDCACAGADCDKLALTIDDCQAAHLACAPKPQLTCGSAQLHANTHTACAAMDATASADGSGAHCNCMLGYAWDGAKCVGLGDCACTGADCDKLAFTLQQCQTAHTACLGTPVIASCNGARPTPAVHSVCDPMDVLGSDDCNCAPLGYAWDGNGCVGITCKCWGADCDKLSDTHDACLAAHQACLPTKRLHCGSSALFAGQANNACQAMDAVASGDVSGGHCNCFLGFAWNGTDCVGLGDCDCIGADCDKLTESYDECIAAHQACAPVLHLGCGSTLNHSRSHVVCGAMDATPSNDHCNCGTLGWAWNGMDCVSFSDACTCTGADCDKLTVTEQECLAAHPSCIPQHLSCSSAQLFSKVHSVCSAMDAQATGDANGSHCYCFLGFAWNGSECVGLGDCTCTGADCDRLTRTIEECQTRHASCS